MGEITPAPAAPTGALRESRCTPETRAGCVPPGCPGPSLWLRLKLCPARRLVTTRVPGPGRTLWQRGLPLPSPPTQPQYPPSQDQRAVQKHSPWCFNKTTKGQKHPKGVRPRSRPTTARTGQVTVFTAQTARGWLPSPQPHKAGLLPLVGFTAGDALRKEGLGETLSKGGWESCLQPAAAAAMPQRSTSHIPWGAHSCGTRASPSLPRFPPPPRRPRQLHPS